MGTSPILTFGLGSYGSVNLLPTLGFGTGASPAGGGVVTVHIFVKDQTIARVFIRDDSPEDVFIQITRG